MAWIKDSQFFSDTFNVFVKLKMFKLYSEKGHLSNSGQHKITHTSPLLERTHWTPGHRRPQVDVSCPQW